MKEDTLKIESIEDEAWKKPFLYGASKFGEDISSGVAASGDVFDLEGFEVLGKRGYHMNVLWEHCVRYLVFTVEVSYRELRVRFAQKFRGTNVSG